MVIADEDLGHRAAARALHHHVARGRIGVDADLFDLLHALGLEDLLGPDAIGADSGGVHLHGLHVRLSSSLRRAAGWRLRRGADRKSTRLNSSHSQISYAVFCLKKKKNNIK